jgi:hypothetical protein
LLSWTDNAIGETSFTIERTNNGTVVLLTAPAQAGTGPATFVDTTITLPNTTYSYRLRAIGAITGPSAWSNTASATTPAYPLAPSPVVVRNGVCQQQGNNNARCTLDWTDVANNTSYTVQWATNATFTTGLVTPNANQQPGANAGTYTTGNIARNTNFYFRIRANNGGSSAWTIAAPAPVHTP